MTKDNFMVELEKHLSYGKNVVVEENGKRKRIVSVCIDYGGNIIIEVKE